MIKHCCKSHAQHYRQNTNETGSHRHRKRWRERRRERERTKKCSLRKRVYRISFEFIAAQLMPLSIYLCSTLSMIIMWLLGFSSYLTWAIFFFFFFQFRCKYKMNVWARCWRWDEGRNWAHVWAVACIKSTKRMYEKDYDFVLTKSVCAARI